MCDSGKFMLAKEGAPVNYALTGMVFDVAALLSMAASINELGTLHIDGVMRKASANVVDGELWVYWTQIGEGDDDAAGVQVREGTRGDARADRGRDQGGHGDQDDHQAAGGRAVRGHLGG